MQGLGEEHSRVGLAVKKPPTQEQRKPPRAHRPQYRVGLSFPFSSTETWKVRLRRVP